MADDTKTFTQEQIDAAVAKATGDLDGLKSKIEELIGDNKRLKADLRKTQDIKPEDVTALEHQVDELTGKLTAAERAAKDATTAAEKATKSLETEQGAARAYALEAEIASAIAEGNVVPALVPYVKATLQQQAKVDLVDGKYVATIADKPVKEHFTALLASEEGKSLKSAALNNGGGAPGGKGSEGGSDLSKLPPIERITAARAAAGA